MVEDLKEWTNKTLPNIEVPIEDINLYMSYEYSSYEIMSIEELSAILLKLKRYTIELKIKYNKEKSKSRWLYSTINKVAKPECCQYESYDKDERLYSVIKGSDVLKKYMDMKIESDAKADLLDGVEKEINNMIYIIKNIQEYKIAKKGFEKQGDYK